MAVSSPGRNAQVTPFTATWPPKRMVRSRVSRERVIKDLVSRTRCGILHAAPQSRDRYERRCLIRPRLRSAPLPKDCALRCVRDTLNISPLVADRDVHVLDL